MAPRYATDLGQDIRRGFDSLGSLFAPPTAQELVAKQSIASSQATQTAQTDARARISAGQGSPADFATLNVADPTKNYVMGKLFAERQEHPDASPATYDSGVYIMGGKAGDTYSGQQMAPLSADQSRIVPPSIAGTLGVPQQQHGVLGLGDGNKMLLGSGAQPIVAAPIDPNAVPKTTDELAARIISDKMRRESAAGAPPPASAPSATPPQLGSTPRADPVVSAVLGAPTPAAAPALGVPDDQIVAAALGRLGKGGAPQTQTTIDMKGETAEAKKFGELAGERGNELMTAADLAPEKIARLKLLSNVLQKTKTGPLAGPTGTAVALANSLGIAPERLTALGIDANQAVNNETAQKLSNELVAGSIGAKGGGFPASNFSVAERQFIEKMFPSISSQPGSNEFVSDVLQAREQRVMQKSQDFAAYRRAQQQAGKPISFNDFDADWQKAHDNENVFQPIMEKFNSGGYAPAGAAPPSAGGVPVPGAPAARPAAPVVQPPASSGQRLTPAQAQALPPGTPFIGEDGQPRVRH